MALKDELMTKKSILESERDKLQASMEAARVAYHQTLGRIAEISKIIKMVETNG